MADARLQNSANDSTEGTAANERAPWRAPVIMRFALERTLSGGQSSGDGLSPHTD